MIGNLYHLGKALEQKEELSDYFSPWQNPFPSGEPDHKKVIFFPIEGGKVGAYEIQPFKTAFLKHYLYRKPSGSNGAPLVPTMPFYPVAYDATVEDAKKEKHLENLEKLLGRLTRSFQSIKKLAFQDETSYEQALVEVESQLAAFNQGGANDRYLLTFQIDGKWLGEFEENLQLFNAEAYSKYYEKSSAQQHLCSITYEEGEVWGRVDTLGFTVNDLTFSRSGFDESQSHKMFPVSPEAVRLLEGAKEYAFSRLSRRYSSMEYIIVPHFIRQPDADTVEKAVRMIEKGDTTQKIEDFSESIFNNERVIKRLAAKDDRLKEGVFYDILFYQKNQAQLALKLHLTDLLPSRFSAIFRAKNEVEHRYQVINRLENKKGEVTNFYITFYKIQRYFSQVIKKETIYHPFFFKLMEAVFYGQTVDEKNIVNAFVKQMQEDFKQRNENALRFIITVKEAFALWHFFGKLGLFTNKKHIVMDGTPSPRNYADFVAAHPDFFDHPYKKAAFNMGCLVSVLTTAQKKKLSSEPFLERLNSLNIDEVELRKLFPAILDKMRQYEKEKNVEYKQAYIQYLKADIVSAMMESTDLDRAQISFAFTAGMVMQKEFDKFGREESKAKKELSATDTNGAE